MSRPSCVYILVFSMVVSTSGDLAAQSLTPVSIARPRSNQVFVKVIVPVTSRTPKQVSLVVESWVAKQLETLEIPEYFAVTDWVPICDALVADEVIDNAVWDGRLDSVHPFCPVSGDIRRQENGRLLISVSGWAPHAGYAANMTLPDEPGSRGVWPVQILAGEELNGAKIEKRLPYVAVLIAPPPQAVVSSNDDAESAGMLFWSLRPD